MIEKMGKFLEFFDRFYRPSIRSYPEINNRVNIFEKNKVIFQIYILLIVVYFLVVIPSSNAKMSNLLYIAGVEILSVVVFLALCRNYQSFYLYLMFILTHGTYGLIIVLRDYLFISDFFPYIFMKICSLPLFTLFLNNNKFLFVLSFSISGYFINFTLKEILTEMAFDTSSGVLLSKIIEGTNFLMIALVVFFSLIDHFLRKAYAEQYLAKSEAQKAYNQLNNFMLNFSHELRNPINSLLGNLTLALDENISPRVKEMIGASKICGDYLLQFINNILDTGKAEMGKLEISLAPTKAEVVVQKVWKISNELLRLKGLKGTLRINSKVPRVLMLDPYRLSQILFNLVGNSVKFTEDGSVNVNLEWIPDRKKITSDNFKPTPYESDSDFDDCDEGGNEKLGNVMTYLGDAVLGSFHPAIAIEPVVKRQEGILKITIKDTGLGMSKEAVSKLFHKFSQVSVQAGKSQNGSGLGLFITREIVDKLGGEIRAFSKLGVGSTFIVCIPTYCSPEHDKEFDFQEIVTDLSKKKLKVFMADDIQFNLDLMKMYLSKVKADIVGTALNGNDAFNKFVTAKQKGENFDLIVLDFGLSILDGREVAKKIRAYEAEKGLKPHCIFIVSGYWDQNVYQTLYDKNGPYKIDFLIRKPVFYEELVEAIAKYFLLEKQYNYGYLTQFNEDIVEGSQSKKEQLIWRK